LIRASCGAACEFDNGDWHNNFDAMIAARRFNDRILENGQIDYEKAVYSKERGMLNRRAEITIVNAAECSLPPSNLIQHISNEK